MTINKSTMDRAEKATELCYKLAVMHYDASGMILDLMEESIRMLPSDKEFYDAMKGLYEREHKIALEYKEAYAQMSKDLSFARAFHEVEDEG